MSDPLTNLLSEGDLRAIVALAKRAAMLEPQQWGPFPHESAPQEEWDRFWAEEARERLAWHSDREYLTVGLGLLPEGISESDLAKEIGRRLGWKAQPSAPCTGCGVTGEVRGPYPCFRCRVCGTVTQVPEDDDR